ncbi:MAG: hypothetical protein Kow002_05120 [Anaerolineales bacterium]
MKINCIISAFAKVINISSVLLVLIVITYNVVVLKQDAILGNNWMGRLVLLGLSLAAATGAIELVLRQFKESVPSPYTIAITVVMGIILFILMTVASLLYLDAIG